MGKNAVIYFSVYGTARKTAAEIAKQVGADLIEIEPVTAYDSNRDHYDALARLTKVEHDQDIRPPIKNEINVREYDNIFLGYPIWWYEMPMVMQTFFDTYDFSGKAIIPFNTHAGSRDGGTYEDIAELEPNATVLDGLAVAGERAEDAEASVKEWLSRLGY